MSSTYFQTAFGIAFAFILGAVLFSAPPNVSAISMATTGQECVGGTVIARDSDYADGVDFTFGMYGFENWCSELGSAAPAGEAVCCSFEVMANEGLGGGYPVGVRTTVVARTGAHEENTTCGRDSPTSNNIVYSCFVTYPPASSCTPVVNRDAWYSGGTIVSIASERASNAISCESEALNAGYPYWNRSVENRCPGVGSTCEVDPANTTCYGVRNPTGLVAKSSTNPPGGYPTRFDSGNVCPATAGVTAALVANPTTITLGQSSLLSWGSTGAKFCVGTNFDTGNAVSGSLLVSPSVTTKYSVLCTNGVQDAQAHQVVTVVEGDGDGNGGGGGGGGQCSDGIDNNGDGLVDAQDPGCLTGGGGGAGGGGVYDPNDNSEGGGGGGGVSQCSDGIDNNRDGTLDYPNDPGCSTADDNLELSEPALITLSVNPPLIKKNQQCTITLSARNVASCSLVGSGISRTYTATAGIVTTKEVVTPGLAQTATYTLSCKGLDGKTASKKVDCKIAPTFEEI